MGGGLLQLVAYGAQDVYLTGNPQITFFKVVYRRHTNFSIESIQQTFNGNINPSSRVTCQISRNGDLVHKLYIAFANVANNTSSTEYIDKVEIEIGGQMIDRQYGEWMEIWNELSLPIGKKEGFTQMTSRATATEYKYLPLEFWFCRNIGLALPLIALQYHEVKINIEFSSSLPADADATLWADYIFLDTDERRRFAQLSHEYLIEQVQFTGSEQMASGKLTAKLSFNHPVKELIWKGATAGCGKAKLMLNGNDRFAEREEKYFTHVQPYQHHTNIPAANKYINVYSFALKPEEHQPSGTLNMSRIDTAQLRLDAGTTTQTVSIYAHSYNVLRILSGMGGLAYSN
tara:strand:+ start:849 stop:1883 length:1035 start_codon:yes stop_codon:yes gene_type:complete